jgi:hypothetical protein
MSAIVIQRPRNASLLPDNKQFTNRFEIHSETSDRVYVVAQHKTGRWWSCGCFGWIRFRRCKHLSALGLPSNQQPYEALLK